MICKVILYCMTMCCLGFGISVGAADSDVSTELSSGALKAERAYQDSLAKIQKSAQAKVERTQAGYIKTLEKEMKAELRENGISAANDVQVLITALDEVDPLVDIFRELNAIETDEVKEKIKIERAYGRRMRGQVWDVTKDIQALVDAGKRSFRPGDDLKGETGFEFGGKLDMEWSVGRKAYSQSFAWRENIDFDKIADEGAER